MRPLSHRAGLALALTAFASRLWFFLGTNEPLGWDGFAYVVQLERLVKEGHLHWPDSSWVVWALAALHVVIPSAVLAVKVGASALVAAVVLVAARRPPLGALAVWAAMSPVLTHLGADFPKNLGAVAPLLFVLGWRRGDSKVALLVAVLLAAFAHRTGAALAGLIALGALLGAGASRVPVRALLFVGAGALGVFALATSALPGLLHPDDLARVGGQLDLGWHAPPPFFSPRPGSALEVLELALAWPALLLGAWRFVRRPADRARLGAALLPLLVCVFPLWRTDTLDLGYRLALLSPVFTFTLLLDEVRVGREAFIVALGLTLFVPRAGFSLDEGPPLAQWRAIIARIPRPLPTLLIAPQGLNFLYDHETGHEAMAWAPGPEIDHAQVWRLAFDVRDGEWLDVAGGLEPAPMRLGANVLYVREDVWEQFLQRADPELRERLEHSKNPLQVRPPSLLRNR
ncbi:MAG: hypothetical protein U0228_35225 [Myxococcaceae bacterium]